MIQYLLNNYAVSKEIAKDFLNRLSAQKINVLLSEYPEEILSSQKKSVISKFLIGKINILEKLLKEDERND